MLCAALGGLAGAATGVLVGGHGFQSQHRVHDDDVSSGGVAASTTDIVEVTRPGRNRPWSHRIVQVAETLAQRLRSSMPTPSTATSPPTATAVPPDVDANTVSPPTTNIGPGPALTPSP
ncbi:hypothetical protein Vretimale_10478, partial [Volvox reticuliferus]